MRPQIIPYAYAAPSDLVGKAAIHALEEVGLKEMQDLTSSRGETKIDQAEIGPNDKATIKVCSRYREAAASSDLPCGCRRTSNQTASRRGSWTTSTFLTTPAS